ncbi:MAG: hypothetical protein DMG60_02795 [Acidobacteria bacterium]|nr:MAG: hypothetical protein DMG60_02795 [Acidobacteriota bacterium]
MSYFQLGPPRALARVFSDPQKDLKTNQLGPKRHEIVKANSERSCNSLQAHERKILGQHSKFLAHFTPHVNESHQWKSSQVLVLVVSN